MEPGRDKKMVGRYRMDKQQGLSVWPGNYIQYPVINRNGKEYLKKEFLYMYNLVTLLYSGDWHNIANQQQKIKLKKKRLTVIPLA